MTIKVDLKIFALILLFIISGQSTTYLIIFAFTVIHEIGHLLCGIILGLKPIHIKIMPLGLSVLFDKEKEKWWKELLISITGPAVNFAIAIALMFISYFHKRDTIIYANLIIGLFNLLPIIPLDGGRVLNAILKRFYVENKAEEYTFKISNAALFILTAIASIGTFYLKNIAIPTIIIYIWIAKIHENKRHKLKQRIENVINQNLYT